jgi:small subunit ribosomal protein S8
MITDPISDMLTRIRNATAVRKPTVDLPSSKIKKEIARILKEEGFVRDIAVVDAEPVAILRIELKYVGRKGVIQSIRRISKPGQRVYRKSTELPRVLNGLGMAIVSTSRGIMTDRQARKERLGGEILFEIY